ncbi:AAWKG family protein [Streptomyces bluensis]|uniref:AAWKG family protein n=2 Tax=Streptomyces bluensis TaxID=33897 RepID=UPI0036A9A4DB
MSDKVPVAHSDNDYWEVAVKVLTGYPMPKRSTLFDSLIGNDDIPLMRVEFSDHNGEPSNAIVDAVDDMEWRSENSGWRISNTDFVVPFYSGKHGPISSASVGTKVVMKKARITMLGTTSTDAPPAGGVVLGGEFKSGLGKDFEGQSKDTEWSNEALSQYSYGGGKALEQLLNTGSTLNFRWNNLGVTDGDAVDLDSFFRAADAFDRAAQFFRMRHQELQDMEFDLGKEEASWKGQAAGVFRDMIHGLVRNYESYSEQFPTSGDVKSKYGDDLRNFRTEVEKAARNLYNTWDSWQLLTGNPLRWLHDVLLEVTDYVWDNNITKVRYYETYGQYGYAIGGNHKVKYEGFRGDHPDYGPLEEKSTWKKIGEEAIRRWQNTVIERLGESGKRALVDVENAFNDQTFPKKIDTVTTSLSDEFSKDQAEREKADLEKEKEEQERELEEKEREQEEKEAEAERRAEEKEREWEEKQAEAERRAEEKEREAEAKQAEAEAKQAEKEREQEEKQAEAERRAEEKQAEAEAKQAEKEAEQEQKQAEAERRAEAKQAEAEAKQAEKEAEQEQKQAEAEQRAEQQANEQQARQEQLQAEQEQKQAEAEQRAEEQQAKAEQRAEEQQQQQILATNQARADNERQQKEQERKQAEAEQRAEEKQAEAEAKQAEKEAEQEQKQAEAERKAEEKQAEQEAKAEEQQKQAEEQRIKTEAEYEEKQAEQERKAEERQAEQEARQEQLQAEQEARAEEQQRKAEEQQAEQEAKQEQRQAEQDARVEEQQARQEQLQKEAEQRAEQQAGEQQARQEQLQGEAEQRQREYEERQAQQISDAQARYDEQQQAARDLGLGGEREIRDPVLDSLNSLPDYGGGQGLDGSGAGMTTLNPDGSVTQDYPDGSYRTIELPSGDTTTVLPDGSTTNDTLRPGETVTNPDGSTTTLNRDGRLTTEFPDGSSSVLDPDKGSVTYHQPDGSSVTTPIDRGQTLPSDLGGGTSDRTAYSSPYDGSGYGYEEELYDDTPYSSGPSGNGSGGGGGGGMPMLPPGTRMNGMTTGGPNDAERVRGSFDDSQVVTQRATNPASRNGSSYEQEIPVAQRGATATTSAGMPFYPPMGGGGAPGQQQTESSDRDRASWVPEDEDVWGTDEGGAPAVIGR